MSCGRVLLLNVVGLTAGLLEHMPNLGRLATRARLRPVLPAVTCSVQSSMLTGLLPAEHGIVGNGWYFRDLGEIHLWRQHNRLVGGTKIWEAARAEIPGYRAANLCWWYAMGASTDITVTPRPVYHADGRKSPDCYVRPPRLHDELTAQLGPFPLFQYWGPTAAIASSRWIAAAGMRVLDDPPELTMAYLPHLDYDLQRYGPDSAAAARAARAVDAAAAPLLEKAAASGITVLVVSEYGITAVSRPVHVNRALRAAGLLEVYTQEGMEYLDPWTSRAFAVADHQIAHVYVPEATDLSRARAVLAELPGVDQVLDREGQRAYGIDHARAGELVLVAEPDAWFTYYYWNEDAHAPDFARGVEIHRKPGYDPAELFFDPADPLAKAKAAMNLVRKRAGLRYRMSMVPTDAGWVRGSHGRLPDTAADSPLVLCSRELDLPESVPVTDIKNMVLSLQGLRETVPAD
ncbi:nucleotide pyrophosphatase/phosphodiesterase family protein [Sciscionella sediminilitoris]|uniref:nucleotide pyrophosphatase/phosphodiesterase family protein n=1 Tax=Sciscionella sediminilitoris TaxID=1445613 RepID=UPI0004DF3D45|nr:nucleotide pyrophosphatase/phosphodiesterase family protein [Sciscionella sp. SE31]